MINCTCCKLFNLKIFPPLLREWIDVMSKCNKCGTETGFIGSLSFNKQTGRCGKCESEVKQSLMRFRMAFLNFYSDGIFTDEKWSRLLAGAANDRLNIEEARMFIRADALNLLNRILIFATANGFIRDEEERTFYYVQKTLAIPDVEAKPLLDRLRYLKNITNIRRGTLPTAYPSIRLNASRQALRNKVTMRKSVWKIEEKEGTYDSPNHFTPNRYNNSCLVASQF
jgi:hypothetical protein